MRTRVSRWRAAVWALGLCLGALSMPGCSQRIRDDQLYEWMERFSLEGQWGLAEHFARMYTTRHPRDSAGHFYLGYRYLHSPRPWFGVALGEYQLALQLFEENGRVNPIPRFEEAAVFETMCHLEISKVYQKQILFLMDAGAPREAFPPLLEQWQSAVDRVRAINPNSNDVRQYDRLIREFKGYLDELPSSPNGFQLEVFGT